MRPPVVFARSWCLVASENDHGRGGTAVELFFASKQPHSQVKHALCRLLLAGHIAKAGPRRWRSEWTSGEGLEQSRVQDSAGHYAGWSAGLILQVEHLLVTYVNT